jgi:hypothetical protein
LRTLQRNKRKIWYSLYQGVTDQVDDDGLYTGEHPASYTKPRMARMNVSGGRGYAEVELFGIENPFKITVVTDDLTTPFSTDTIWWFGVDAGSTADEVPHTHRCTGVSRTPNQVVIALAEVDFSHADNNH